MACASLGGWHVCAADNDGRLFAWGGNEYGQAGVDTGTGWPRRSRVAPPVSSRTRALSSARRPQREQTADHPGGVRGDVLVRGGGKDRGGVHGDDGRFEEGTREVAPGESELAGDHLSHVEADALAPQGGWPRFSQSVLRPDGQLARQAGNEDTPTEAEIVRRGEAPGSGRGEGRGGQHAVVTAGCVAWGQQRDAAGSGDEDRADKQRLWTTPGSQVATPAKEAAPDPVRGSSARRRRRPPCLDESGQHRRENPAQGLVGGKREVDAIPCR